MIAQDNTPIRFTPSDGPCTICLADEEDVATWYLAMVDRTLPVCSGCWSNGPLAAAHRLRQRAGEVDGDDFGPLIAFAEALQATAAWLEGLTEWPQ